MTFEEKVAFLRALPQIKVVPISEVKAVAFAAREVEEPEVSMHILGTLGTISLALSLDDIEKIVRIYPDLKAKLTPK